MRFFFAPSLAEFVKIVQEASLGERLAIAKDETGKIRLKEDLLNLQDFNRYARSYSFPHPKAA